MDKDILALLVKDAKKVYDDNEMMQRVVVTQGIHESGFASAHGESLLALEDNNLFGIKAKAGEPSVSMPTWEYINGENVKVNALFAKYEDFKECFEAHRELMEKPRYERVMNAGSIEEAFHFLQVCGYATDPQYPQLLLNIYNEIVKDAFDD